MEEDVKNRFEDFDKRLSSSDKRIDDIKWFFGGLTFLFTLVFSLSSYFGHMNFIAERERLDDEIESLSEFKDQVIKDVGLKTGPIKIELKDINGSDLDGKEVRAHTSIEWEKNQKKLYVTIYHVIRNSGTSLSGPLFLKVYTSDPLTLSSGSADEKKYQYENVLTPDEYNPTGIPGGIELFWHIKMQLGTDELPSAGKYPALIKLYYGNGQFEQAFIHIVIPEQQD